ncbi:hypothetical protein AKO1_014156 [Acrasis kona]|uniref:ADP-ribosylation factor n=1 Tax=Acrasis kona TaxID=1008807 RepID=A0AAW2Z0S4_9EUKA
MFSLLHGLFVYATQKKQFNVLVLGLDGAGKTLLIESIKTIFTKTQGMGPEKITPTFGLNVADVEVNGVKLKFWDMGGKKDFRSLWKEYFKSCHALIYVVDASDSNIHNLEESQKEFEMLRSEKDLDGVPLMIMANYRSFTEPPSPQTPMPTPIIAKERGTIHIAHPVIGTEREQVVFRKIFIDSLDQGAGSTKDNIYFVKTISALTGGGVEDSIQVLIKYLKDHARQISDEDFI